MNWWLGDIDWHLNQAEKGPIAADLYLDWPMLTKTARALCLRCEGNLAKGASQNSHDEMSGVNGRSKHEVDSELLEVAVMAAQNPAGPRQVPSGHIWACVVLFMAQQAGLLLQQCE